MLVNWGAQAIDCYSEPRTTPLGRHTILVFIVRRDYDIPRRRMPKNYTSLNSESDSRCEEVSSAFTIKFINSGKNIGPILIDDLFIKPILIIAQTDP